MSFSVQNVQTKSSVEETLYNLKKFLNSSTGSTGSSSFDGLLSYSSTGPVTFTALNTDVEDYTSTSSLNLLIGDSVSSSTGAYIQYGNYLNSYEPQTQIYTPGTLSLQSHDNKVLVSGTLNSDYINVYNSINLGIYPDNGSLTYDEISLLQGTSIIPTSLFDPASLTIDQKNGFIWTIDNTYKIIYKIDSNNTVVAQTSLSAFTVPVDLTIK